MTLIYYLNTDNINNGRDIIVSCISLIVKCIILMIERATLN